MATNSIGKGRFKVGGLIVGNPPSDGGPNVQSGVIMAGTGAAGAQAGITVSSISGATSAVVTFSAAHNLQIGQIITIAGTTATGGTNTANTTAVVTAVGGGSGTGYTTATLGGLSTSGLTITTTSAVVTLVVPPAAAVTAATAISGTTTITVTAPGQWQQGDQVIISGATGTNVNGTQTIATGGNGTFTYKPSTTASGVALGSTQVIAFPIQESIPSGPSPQWIKGIYTFQNITLLPSASLTDSATPATQSEEFTVTLPGVNLGDIVLASVNNQASLGVAGAAVGLIYSVAVTGTGEVTVTLTNVSGATITAANATLTFSFLWIRLV